MFKIVRKKELNSAVTLMEIEAPFVAKKAKAGQFIIFRVDETGERVPLTIAGYDREKGTVAIIFQKVGLTTKMAAASAVRSLFRPLRRSRRQAPRSMSLSASAARISSFWKTSSRPAATICTS